MKVIYGLNNLRRITRGNRRTIKRSVVAIGIFDGVHLGHRHILKRLVKKSRRLKATGICLTFWPHPKNSPFIYSLEHRLNLISKFDVDYCLVINFTAFFSNIRPVDFVKKILKSDLKMISLVVGSNFRFGKDACANINTLKKIALDFDFSINEVRPLKIKNKIISSTNIRNYITNGNLQKAARFLGKRVSVFGTVTRGWRLGRVLGFPTANIDPHHEVLPPSGVYAVVVKFDNKTLFGACYIGTRPSIKAFNKIAIEVHILNFKGSIYGKNLYIEFIRRTRREKRFKNKLSLCLQIKRDISKIKGIFGLT